MTSPEPHLDPARRHDVVILFDVTDGNPNGDPDGGNQPRTDDETGQGLVTDVALKRKIRDTAALLHPDDPRYGLFVQAGQSLNSKIGAAAEHHPDSIEDAQRWLCERYFDIRMFGAVLSTGSGDNKEKDDGGKKKDGKQRTAKGVGQIRGPVQLTFARSYHPVLPVDHSITRVTQTKQEDIDKGETTEMGGKWTIPYGLYGARLYYSAGRAAKTGVTSEDLDTLWRSIATMVDHDRSATRGEMKICGLYIFSHSDALGNAPAASLTDRIRPELRDTDKPPRHHSDYQLTIDRDGLPADVTLTSPVNLWP